MKQAIAVILSVLGGIFGEGRQGTASAVPTGNRGRGGLRRADKKLQNDQ